jgi:transcriptional regulator with GAF, ATPase, and Fis domain
VRACCGPMSDPEDPPDVETEVEPSRSGQAVPEAWIRAVTLSFRDEAGHEEERVVDRTMTLGSARSNDVAIDDPLMSRLHAELELRDDGLWIRDLGSRNGTHVDGVRIGSARIADHAQITVGRTAITARYAARPESAEVWPTPHLGPLIGRSLPMRRLFAQIARLAKHDASVLVEGETGTGKELVAQAIHELSSRAGGPFVVVDCGAMAASLVEAELFGVRRGAFTGAHETRDGAFEEASGGTLFLDEIGELPPAIQPKLLRALESRTVRRVGDTQSRPVDVRFVFATHRDLRRMVNEGTFREDLYFRIAVVPLRVPPLRDRLDDVPLLAAHFAHALGHPVLPAALLQRLGEEAWLGNVRELRNAVARALVLGPDAAAMPPPAPPPPGRVAEPARAEAAPADGALPDLDVDVGRPLRVERDRWLNHVERTYVQRLLAAHGSNVTAAAAAAQLDRSYLHRLIRKHSL